MAEGLEGTDTRREGVLGSSSGDHVYAKSALHHSPQRHAMAHDMTPDDIQFYTGLSHEVFINLVHAVSVVDHKKGRQLTLEDQVLLTLMRLRLGLLLGHLSRIFKVSVTCVSMTIIRTVNKLCKVMEHIVMWLPASYIQNSMPQSFKENGYSSTTCIIDCTEVPLQRPKKLMARAQTYSAYKANNTIKFLTAIAPNGFIMFVSQAYGGRASDKFIMRDSGIEEKLSRGDEVMADRGFSLSLHLQVEGVKLNVPAFTKGKTQLSEKEVTATRRIASVRIHVERAINRIKTYRILQHPLPIKSKELISKIVFVCAGLCNLKPPLIRGCETDAE
ncbi:uncharacterized protein LOC135379167 [Ornithodoros turicata]|uniref:uncharacterized protein LOC135379167 n=1 Tax=Ornithodoros turicata TaxID=34597 RepID=UPI003138C1E1